MNGETQYTNEDIEISWTDSGTSSNNSITINGITYSNSALYGGYSSDSDVSGNILTITSGTLGTSRDSANNGVTNIYGGYSVWGNAYGNSITISGGDFSNTTEITGGYAPSGSASGNSVTITGGTFHTSGNAYIAGGRGYNASNNTVNIGSPSMTDGTQITLPAGIFGGYSTSSTGNTLNVYTINNSSVHDIFNFQTINFYIPASATSGSTMLTLTSSSGTDLSGVSINAGVVSGSPLTQGDTINLITNSNGITTDSSTTYGTLSEGVSNSYSLSLSQSGNSIIATIGDVTNDDSSSDSTSSGDSSSSETLLDQTRLIGQSGAGGAVIPVLGRGTDRLIGWLPPDDFAVVDTNAQTTAEDSSKIGEGSDEKIVLHNDKEIFFDMSGGKLKTKLKNGGYIDTKDGGIDLGYARTFQNSHGTLNIAPIVDYGRGSYDSYLSDGRKGEGTASYWAGGVIARQTNRSGLYYEGSIRAGRSKMDFDSDDLTVGSETVHTSYDTSATILAGHLRLGYLLRPRKKDILHVYGIYAHNHQNGSSADLVENGVTGEHYDFDSVDSGRFRMGVRATRAIKPFSRVYTGLAYQYEYSGEAIARYNGSETPSTKMQGSSGLLEIGWQVKPTQSSPWMIDLNTTGWVGHQQGFTASIKVKKEF